MQHSMHYELYDLFRQNLLQPLNFTGRVGQLALEPFRPFLPTPVRGHLDAAYASLHALERLTRMYPKQPFNLGVEEEVVWSRPFCELIRFPAGAGECAARAHHRADVGPSCDAVAGDGRVTGPTHQVFITDWADAKFVPLGKGRFDLDAYVAYVMEIFRFLARAAHFMCSRCVSRAFRRSPPPRF